jgi:phosphatidate cytidylyltransferase
MITQYYLHRKVQKPLAAPAISTSFNWYSMWMGVLAGSIVGGLLAGITPWVPGTAFAFSFIACTAGSMGHLVMKALKRDRGIPSWGPRVASVTGAGGLLNRVDALCFAAPVFFHSAKWYFDI